MNRFEQQVEELIQDISFINYCQKKDDLEAAVWETRLLTQPELIPIVKEAAKRVRMIRKGIEEAEMEISLGKLKSSLTILQPEQQPKEQSVYTLFRRRKWWMAVAGILLLAGALTGYLQGWIHAKKLPQIAASEANHIIVPAGERKSLRLRDGTTVQLNGGTDLTLSDGFNEDHREVKLTGEGYFNVKSDARTPFIIHTSAMDIKVLGTSFNVRSYPDETTDATSLIRGKIEVMLTDGINKPVRYILHPMQKLVVEKVRATKKISYPEKELTNNTVIHLDSLFKNKLIEGFTETAWTEHNLVFYDETLEQVAFKMEKWFGADIEFKKDALRKVKYTGTFENEPMEKVLEVMKLSIPGLQYSVNGKKIVLY